MASNLPNAACVFDRDMALEQVDGDLELFAEIVGMFFDDTKQYLAQIDQAIESANAEALAVAAHTIKGMAGNFAAHRVVEVALKLEMMGRDNDLTNAQDTLRQLKYEIDLLAPKLRECAQAGK